MLRGEAGIGKSSLLDHARSRTTSTVISTSGTEAESAIPFAGLGDVLRPLLGLLDSDSPSRMRLRFALCSGWRSRGQSIG